jgi:hypothetical protein
MVKKISIVAILLIIIITTFTYIGLTGLKIQKEQEAKQHRENIKNTFCNQIIIKLFTGEDRASAEEIASEVEGKIVDFFPPNTYHIELPSYFTLEEVKSKAAILKDDPRVMVALPNIIMNPLD